MYNTSKCQVLRCAQAQVDVNSQCKELNKQGWTGAAKFGRAQQTNLTLCMHYAWPSASHFRDIKNMIWILKNVKSFQKAPEYTLFIKAMFNFKLDCVQFSYF